MVRMSFQGKLVRCSTLLNYSVISILTNSKPANIELLGLKGYIKCQQEIPDLRYPLLARVDFMCEFINR